MVDINPCVEGLDVLAIDIQDIEVCSYTCLGCLRDVMETCFKNGVEVVVLDRPNPLSGLKVTGSIVDCNMRSYVALFPILYVSVPDDWLTNQVQSRRKSVG